MVMSWVSMRRGRFTFLDRLRSGLRRVIPWSLAGDLCRWGDKRSTIASVDGRVRSGSTYIPRSFSRSLHSMAVGRAQEWMFWGRKASIKSCQNASPLIFVRWNAANMQMEYSRSAVVCVEFSVFVAGCCKGLGLSAWLGY